MALKTSGSYPLVNGGSNQCTFSANTTTSDLFDCGNYQAGALLIPSTFAAGTITFLTSYGGDTAGTFYNLKSAGTAFSITVSAGDHVALDPFIFAFIRYFKIVSTVTQTAAQSIRVLLGPTWQ